MNLILYAAQVWGTHQVHLGTRRHLPASILSILVMKKTRATRLIEALTCNLGDEDKLRSKFTKLLDLNGIEL